jgi:hypothetical protein
LLRHARPMQSPFERPAGMRHRKTDGAILAEAAGGSVERNLGDIISAGLTPAQHILRQTPARAALLMRIGQARLVTDGRKGAQRNGYVLKNGNGRTAAVGDTGLGAG